MKIKTDLFSLTFIFAVITVRGVSWRVVQSLIEIESKINVKSSRDRTTTLIGNSCGKTFGARVKFLLLIENFKIFFYLLGKL